MTTATCRCDRHSGHPCDRPITQEDLRCDVCGGRAGYGDRCGSLVFDEFGPDPRGRASQYHVALRITIGPPPALPPPTGGQALPLYWDYRLPDRGPVSWTA